MGKLLRSVFAILVTCWVLAPAHVAAYFDAPRYRAARAELAADRPAEQLLADVKAWIDSQQ